MSDVKVKFGAEDENLTRTLNGVQRELKQVETQADTTSDRFSKGFGRMAGMAAVAGVGVAAGMKAIQLASDAAMAVVNQFGEALDMGGRLNDLSSRTGETAGNLLLLERSFNNAGSSAEKVGPAINKLQKFINDAGDASGTQAKALSWLGVKLSDLKDKTPTDQMKVFAEKITAIQDPTQRAAIAMEIFGKSGGELLPVLQNFSGEIDTARGQLGSLPGVMDRASSSFDGISDNMTVIKGKALEIAAGFLEKAAPAMLTFTNMLTGVDAAGWGMKMMDSIMTLSEGLVGAFKSPMTAVEAIGWEIMAVSAKFTNGMASAFGYAYDFGTKTFGLLANEITDTFTDAFVHSWNLFSLHGQKAILSVQESGAMNGFSALLNTMFDGITDPKNFNFDETFAKYKNAGVDANKELGASLDKEILGATEAFSNGLVDGTNQISSKWAEIKENTSLIEKDIFGAGDASRIASEKWAEMQESGEKIRKDFEKSGEITFDMTKEFNQFPGLTFNMMDHLNTGAASMSKAAKDVKDSLSLSEEIVKRIKEMEGKESVDPGGKLEKKANEAIAEGDGRKAERINDQIRKKEEDAAFNEQFNEGRNIKKSLKDMAKDEGLDISGKSSKELREELKELTKNLKKDNNKEGEQKINEKGGGAGGKGGGDVMEKIKTAVESIQALVAKIEPKLPQTALAQ